MRRPWQTWLIFAVFALVLIGAMGWISAEMLRMEGEQVDSERRAVLEENVRLSLWRMDSFLSPLIAQEQVRPQYMYRSYYPVQRAYDNAYNPQDYGEVITPSPLMTEEWPFVLIYFQFEPDGTLTSPQVPDAQVRDNAVSSGYLDEITLRERAEYLERLREMAPQTYLYLNCADISRSSSVNVVLGNGTNELRGSNGAMQRRAGEGVQQFKGQVEWNTRVGNVESTNLMQTSNFVIDMEHLLDSCEGYMKPMWYGETLLLARRAEVRGQTYIQGCWLDWHALHAELKRGIEDLLPDAALVAYDGEKIDREGRLLANLPVRLEPGTLPVAEVEAWTPIRISLLVAWGCVLLVILAVAGLLHGTMVLSERRGAFVSAVTHEMRTPLTTFRMYTEMLLRGMVPDEEKRRHYVKTMSGEANRLSHMVENVLAYARLEGNGKAGRVEPVELSAIMERVEERLADHAARAKFDFHVDLDPPARETRVLADAAAVEHILFNLVDNACKYAVDAEPREIRLTVRPEGRRVRLAVRDFGPGVRASESHTLFKPFHKSAHRAAESSPGVGLGLALSRRLARRMQGDLDIDATSEQGACFVLSLPMADGNGNRQAVESSSA